MSYLPDRYHQAKEAQAKLEGAPIGGMGGGMGGGKKGGGMQMSAEEQAMMDAIKAEQKASMGPGIDRTADDHSGAPMTVIEAKIEVVRDPTDTAGMGTARLAFW